LFSRREILDFRQPASAGRFFANASLRRFTRLANATRMDAAEAEEVVCGWNFGTEDPPYELSFLALVIRPHRGAK
jgi:hypothetical protein